MSIQQFLGLGFIFVGLVCASSYEEELARLRMRWFYKELGTMQERWGRSAGTILHFVEYVLSPIGIGVLLVTVKVFS